MTRAKLIDVLLLIGYLHRHQPRMDELLVRTGWSLAKAKRVMAACKTIGCDIRAAQSRRVGWHYVMHGSTIIDPAEAAKCVRRQKL